MRKQGQLDKVNKFIQRKGLVYYLFIFWVGIIGYIVYADYTVKQPKEDKKVVSSTKTQDYWPINKIRPVNKQDEMLEDRRERVLGVSESLQISKLEAKSEIESEISKYLELAEKYPGSRDIYLQLTVLYHEKGSGLTARKYLERAKILDPNGEKVIEVERMIN